MIDFTILWPLMVYNRVDNHGRDLFVVPCGVLDWNVLYCTVLYCTVLYCTVVPCGVLDWNEKPGEGGLGVGGCSQYQSFSHIQFSGRDTAAACPPLPGTRGMEVEGVE